MQKEELEQKHVHLLQVVESEKTAKWQYTQQCEELASEIKKLRAEVNLLRQFPQAIIINVIFSYWQICSLRREYSHRPSVSQTPVGRGSFSAGSANADENCSLSGFSDQVQDSAELRKIKKVQSFFRGWLCRRRWKQIVEEYIGKSKVIICFNSLGKYFGISPKMGEIKTRQKCPLKSNEKRKSFFWI